ncbi:MAG: hypothetical protein V1737_06110, partial [Chloroflexota bacterium]
LMKTLRLAIQQQDWKLAAHILVYPAVKVKNAASIVEIMAENERKRMESGTTPRPSTLSRFLFPTLHVKFESCPAIRGQVGVSWPALRRV